MSDPAFEEWKDDALARDIKEVADQLGAKLFRTSEGWAGACPACGGEDRFTISTKERLFWCRGSDVGGDVIKLVQYVQGGGFKEACQFLTGREAPAGETISEQEKVDRARRREELAAKRRTEAGAAATAEQRKILSDREKVQKLFASAEQIAGSHADRYLRARGLSPSGSFGADLRFCPALEYFAYEDMKAKQPTKFGRFPTLLAPIRLRGEIIGVHRTYLDRDHPKKLIPPEPHRRNSAKKISAEQKGGLIWLTGPAAVLVIGEGIETTWSAAQLGIGGDDAAFAAGVSLGNMSGKATGSLPHPHPPADKPNATMPNGEPDLDDPGIDLPEVVREVILVGDGDSDPFTTVARLLTGARRFAHSGRAVFVVMAPRGQDLNDVLLESGAGEQPVLQLRTMVEFEAYARLVMAGWHDGVLRPPKSHFRAKRWVEIGVQSAHAHEWIVNDLIPRRDITLISGASKSGKSFLAIDIFLSIARGAPFFGRKVRRGGVVYVAGEGGNGFEGRLYGYKLHHRLSPEEDLPFVDLPVAVNIYRADGDIEKLIAEVLAWKAYWRLAFNVDLEAVVIDTVAASTNGADENSGKDMGLVLGACKRIIQSCDCAVVLVHHLNAGGTKERGHTSVFANVETVMRINLDSETKIRTVDVVKQKDGEDGPALQFELMQVETGKRLDDGKPITTCVLLPVGEKALRRSNPDGRRGFNLRPPEEIFMRALFAALKLKGGKPTQEQIASGVPSDVEVIHYLDWRAAYGQEAAPDTEGGAIDPKAMKRAFEKVMPALTKYGVIGWKTPWLWYAGKPLRAFPATLPKDTSPKVEEESPEVAAARDAAAADLPF